MDEYRDLINCLPLETVEYAFAYGSGALQQTDEKKEDKMVDFVLVTNDPLRFHTENLLKNSGHYSLVGGFLGKPAIPTALQTKWAARIFYNTQIRVGSRLIKYGVISTEDLKQDLLDWKWLYIAGRLQKPVLDVLSPSTSIQANLLENRKSALHAAFLLLPDIFSTQELYEKIVSLSYNGDIRMKIAEDPHKISKIVSGSVERFQEIYKPLIDGDTRIVYQNGKYLQDASGTAIYHRLHMLPSTPLDILTKRWNKRLKRQQDCEEVMFGMAHTHDVGETVENAIASIVFQSSLRQTVKNALTAGIMRSIVYTSAKLVKRIKL